MVSTPEKSVGQLKNTEAAATVVSQPVKIETNLGSQLGSFLDDINKISESAGSGPANDGAGTSTGMARRSGSTSSSGLSLRDQAIAELPGPTVMQKALEKHIRNEVKTLRKQALSIARMGKPGAAYRLNHLYARIRQLNALLAHMLDASYEALKKMFIRIFIDKQSTL